MRVYLVRHGRASPAADGEKHLSDAGRRGVDKVAALLEPLGLPVGAIRHSLKVRARETAEILAGALVTESSVPGGGERGVAERLGLSPEDDVRPVAEELGGADADVMFVGHLPFMGRLASLLTTGSESADVVAFKAGQVVCIERGSGDNWRILWTVSPEILP